jgi:hypothetical protein
VHQCGTQYRRLVGAFQRILGATIFFGTDHKVSVLRLSIGLFCRIASVARKVGTNRAFDESEIDEPSVETSRLFENLEIAIADRFDILEEKGRFFLFRRRSSPRATGPNINPSCDFL